MSAEVLRFSEVDIEHVVTRRFDPQDVCRIFAIPARLVSSVVSQADASTVPGDEGMRS